MYMMSLVDSERRIQLKKSLAEMPEEARERIHEFIREVGTERFDNEQMNDELQAGIHFILS
jgi:hypothetical protein